MTTSRALANLDQATIGTDDDLRKAIKDATEAGCELWDIPRVLREGVPHRSNHYLPIYTINGKLHGFTYSEHDYDRDTAVRMAKADAENEAARFVGDWDVEVRKL